jgi:hypothetical protein
MGFSFQIFVRDLKNKSYNANKRKKPCLSERFRIKRSNFCIRFFIFPYSIDEGMQPSDLSIV